MSVCFVGFFFVSLLWGFFCSKVRLYRIEPKGKGSYIVANRCFLIAFTIRISLLVLFANLSAFVYLFKYLNVFFKYLYLSATTYHEALCSFFFYNDIAYTLLLVKAFDYCKYKSKGGTFKELQY